MEKKSTHQIKREERKKNKAIPVQSTAKSRRVHKVRGRTVAKGGRRRKDQEKRAMLEVREEDEIVRHSLPKQKKSKQKNPHSFSASVAANRQVTGKH